MTVRSIMVALIAVAGCSVVGAFPWQVDMVFRTPTPAAAFSAMVWPDGGDAWSEVIVTRVGVASPVSEREAVWSVLTAKTAGDRLEHWDLEEVASGHGRFLGWRLGVVSVRFAPKAGLNMVATRP